MIILGIDPGLANTGWGVIETRGPVCRTRAYGCVSSTSKDSLDRRLGRIFEEVSKIVQDYTPAQLAIEKVFFGENSRSAIATAQARGAAIVACAEAGMELGEYTPMQVKQAIVGTGGADKRQVIYMVRNILALGRDPRPDHCADALAVAICHANLSRTRRITQDVASVQMREQEWAQRSYDRALAREATAAASAAHFPQGERDRRALAHARQSRRNSR